MGVPLHNEPKLYNIAGQMINVGKETINPQECLATLNLLNVVVVQFNGIAFVKNPSLASSFDEHGRSNYVFVDWYIGKRVSDGPLNAYLIS